MNRDQDSIHNSNRDQGSNQDSSYNSDRGQDSSYNSKRNEEYSRLLAELENTPPALDYAVTRAKARAKKTGRIRHFFTIPVSSLVVCLFVFAITVNLSAPFAMACGRIPFIRELAAAVAFSPSLSAAVLNEYVQPIELEQTENGITMSVEYVIVDQKQVNVFYSLQSKIYANMDATPSISNADGTPMENYSISARGVDSNDGELRQFTIDFVNEDVPSELTFMCKVHDNGASVEEGPAPIASGQTEQRKEPDVLSSFTFELTIDPYYMRKGEVVTLNQRFILDGQHLTIIDVEIYPTHIRLNLLDDDNNTAWLQSLSFYLINEKGEKFEAISNGITATGAADSPFMASHRLESAYFSESKNLTLYITGAVWLDKDMERVKIDLVHGVAEALPEGVVFEQALRNGSSSGNGNDYGNGNGEGEGNGNGNGFGDGSGNGNGDGNGEGMGWKLVFSGVEREENHSYQLFGTTYFDDAGNEYEFRSWTSTAMDYFDEKTNDYTEVKGVFKVQFSLEDYPFDTVYLSPSFSRTVHLSAPVEINVK